MRSKLRPTQMHLFFPTYHLLQVGEVVEARFQRRTVGLRLRRSGLPSEKAGHEVKYGHLKQEGAQYLPF